MFMSPFASPKSLGQMYRKTTVEIDVHAASPHRLVALLFEGLLEALTRARGAIEAGNVQQKSDALRRAIAILDEGLKSALNLKDGGRIAADLNDLYAYMSLRLTQANLRNNVQPLEECRQLLLPLQQAWNEIGPRVEARTEK